MGFFGWAGVVEFKISHSEQCNCNVFNVRSNHFTGQSYTYYNGRTRVIIIQSLLLDPTPPYRNQFEVEWKIGDYHWPIHPYLHHFYDVYSFYVRYSSMCSWDHYNTGNFWLCCSLLFDGPPYNMRNEILWSLWFYHIKLWKQWAGKKYNSDFQSAAATPPSMRVNTLQLKTIRRSSPSSNLSQSSAKRRDDEYISNIYLIRF